MYLLKPEEIVLIRHCMDTGSETLTKEWTECTVAQALSAQQEYYNGFEHPDAFMQVKYTSEYDCTVKAHFIENTDNETVGIAVMAITDRDVEIFNTTLQEYWTKTQ